MSVTQQLRYRHDCLSNVKLNCGIQIFYQKLVSFVVCSENEKRL